MYGAAAHHFEDDVKLPARGKKKLLQNNGRCIKKKSFLLQTNEDGSFVVVAAYLVEALPLI